MRYPDALVEGWFLRRYKRFFADIELKDGSVVTAHCANTGAMTGCTAPRAPVRLSRSTNPSRKLAWSLEQIRVGGHWIMVHTGRHNRIVEEGILDGRVPELSGYTTVEREKRSGEARLDLRLTEPGRCWVEVKGVTMRCSDDVLRFPDAVTTRGRRHLEVLRALAVAGDRAILFLHVGHEGGGRVEPAWEVDPLWAEALVSARASGVEVLAYRCALSSTSVTLAERVPFSA